MTEHTKLLIKALLTGIVMSILVGLIETYL
jgi:hypothetical protein